VEVTTIQKGHLDGCPLQGSDGVKPPEPSTQYDDPMLVGHGFQEVRRPGRRN
jgi:hypothetical protein